MSPEPQSLNPKSKTIIPSGSAGRMALLALPGATLRQRFFWMMEFSWNWGLGFRGVVFLKLWGFPWVWDIGVEGMQWGV